MSNPTLPTAPDENPNFAPQIYGITLLVVAIIVCGFVMVNKFTDAMGLRDMQTWREKLNLIAESRVSDVDAWVNGNFKELRTLADNPSLQLYMTELQMMKEPEKKAGGQKESMGEPSQKSYLRNLMLYTAQRAGFGAAGNVNNIPANVEKGSKSGLALMDNNGAVLVSTVLAPGTKELMAQHVAQAAPGQEALIDIRKDKDGVAYLGFIVPIYSIQGEHNAASQIGRVVGIRTLNDSGLFPLLKHPGVTEKTLETVIVRNTNDKVEYLSPLMDGSEAMSMTEDYNVKKLADAQLLATPGSFVYDLADYRGKRVLATSRAVNGTPWALVIKIDADEALADSLQRRASLQMVLFLLTAVIALIVAATWWRANSKRSVLMSGHFKRMAEKAQAQEQLLRLVADHQPEPIYIVDGENQVRFANQKAADEAHMSIESIPGRSLWDVRGGARAKHVAEKCGEVLKAGQTAYELHREDTGKGRDAQKVFRNAYVPLDHIPLVTLPKPTRGVLVVEQDISEVMHEREQRLKTQRQLIETLVTLVDKRDPFSANHSTLVSQLAYEAAVQMELDSVTIETTSKAGSLMNIGKILVPTELLTKASALTFEEKRTIHESMNTAAELMDGISFDGPVAETLRQWQERWDGSGPIGLRGEDILISARIIAAANAFIGMVSPRSWRNAMSIEAANKFLLEQSDVLFDRRVVVALINFMDNHDGKEWLMRTVGGKAAA